jgi:hypothetical protein
MEHPSADQHDRERAEGERKRAAAGDGEGHVSSVPGEASRVCDGFEPKVELRR